jgi:hypothetical protein
VTGSSVARTGAGSVRYQAIDNVNLRGGDGRQVYEVLDTEHGFTTTLALGAGGSVVNIHATTGALVVEGGAGDDAVTVGSTAQGVEAIRGRLTLRGNGGHDTLTFDDSLTTRDATYALGTDVLTRTVRNPAPNGDSVVAVHHDGIETLGLRA